MARINYQAFRTLVITFILLSIFAKEKVLTQKERESNLIEELLVKRDEIHFKIFQRVRYEDVLK